MLIIEPKQELLDPQMAPVWGHCRCCGDELYSRDALTRWDGLCEQCAAEGERMKE